MGRWDFFDDRVEEGFHAGVFDFIGELARPFFDGVTVFARGVDGGKIKLLVGGVEFEEEFKNHVEDLVGARIGAIDFVDDDDGSRSDL